MLPQDVSVPKSACLHQKHWHDTFINLEYHKTHQNGQSHLYSILPDFISAFPLDYMHLACLGAVRYTKQFWIKKKDGWLVRLSSHQVLQISGQLVTSFQVILSLMELDRWKATEFQQFRLYTGPLVLNTERNLYKHFLNISVSISIMLMQVNHARQQYLEYACKLLHHCVANCEQMYGKNFLAYNIHSPLHLGDDARFFRAPIGWIEFIPCWKLFADTQMTHSFHIKSHCSGNEQRTWIWSSS